MARALSPINQQVSSIGERVYARRVELGLSQKDLSEPGLTFTFISRIETGVRGPSMYAVLRLAELLDVSPLWLLTGDLEADCPFCGSSSE